MAPLGAHPECGFSLRLQEVRGGSRPRRGRLEAETMEEVEGGAGVPVRWIRWM